VRMVVWMVATKVVSKVERLVDLRVDGSAGMLVVYSVGLKVE